MAAVSPTQTTAQSNSIYHGPAGRRRSRRTRALAIRLSCSMDYPYGPSEQNDSEGIPPLVLAHCLAWYELLSGLYGLRELFVGQAKTALSSLIIEQGTQQIVAAKIGPEHRGKI